MQLRIGYSNDGDSAKAARGAVELALAGVDAPVFALVFTTDRYHHDALAGAVTEAIGPIPWAGCCSAGVFANDVFLRQGVVVGVLGGRGVRVGVGLAGPASEDGRAAGRLAVERALSGLGTASAPTHRALIVLPDALTGDAAAVVRGAVAEAGTGVTWAGGGAGDNLAFLRTAQYADGRAHRDHVVVVAIEADAPLGGGIRHGWRPYGPPTLVTRVSGSIAIELDFEPAFDVYQRTAADRGDGVTRETFAEFSTTHPLGIPQADGEHVIRDPLAVLPDGSLRCVAEVPDGSMVRVMRGDRTLLLEAAHAAASEAARRVGGALAGAVVFDCVSRSLLLGGELCDELGAFRAGLPPRTPVFGCLTFGEVGALGAGVPQFHNKTVVVLGLPA